MKNLIFTSPYTSSIFGVGTMNMIRKNTLELYEIKPDPVGGGEVVVGGGGGG